MLPRACDQLVLSRTSPDRCVRCDHPASAHHGRLVDPKRKTGHIWGDTLRPDLCRSCRRRIYWAEMVDSQKPMPFDVRPAAIVVAVELQTGREKWLVDLADSHWSTCPHAALHRRRR